jgi:hypothetical protein
MFQVAAWIQRYERGPRLETPNYMPQLKLTADILAAALEGFEAQKNRIDERIAEIRQMLGGSTAPAALTGAGKPRKKRSAAVRRKMALAQKARWAKIKQASAPPQAVAAKPKKRKFSASGRREIIAATKKRWARSEQSKRRSQPPRRRMLI